MLKKVGPKTINIEAGRGRALLILLLIGLFCALSGCGSKTASAASNRPKQNTRQNLGTIVAIGDSLTAGAGVDEQMAYPAQLERKLRGSGYTYTVVNAGISGETSSGALSRIQWVLTSLKPDIVILETGANDGLRGIDPKLLESNLEQLIKILKDRNIVIVLAGMKMLPNLGPDYLAAFGRIYPRLAEKYHLIFMPFFLEGVAGDPALNQPDGLHPTAAGYTRLVDNLCPYVIEAIRNYSERGANNSQSHK